MNPVQQKIVCVYEIGVSDETSNKRSNQTFKVVATERINEQAEIDVLNGSAKVTEKLDGTCCLVQEFQGRPWLWARYDRKPSKAGERRLALFKKNKQKLIQNGERADMVFRWDSNKDFKAPPEHWVPASKLEQIDGITQPDSIGHTPGWIPVQANCRQQCWHLSAVDLDLSLALVLSPQPKDPELLLLESQPLSGLCGQTCELIGTNINGNPYNLGTKQCPVHVLVPHGCMTLDSPSPADYRALYNWFTGGSLQSLVEGLVWHCDNGALYKLHRHHLNLKWPLAETYLGQKKVHVQVPPPRVTSVEPKGNDLFLQLSALNGQVFNSLKDLHLALTKETITQEAATDT